MTIGTSTWLFRRKWFLLAVSLPVLVALWWAFRPEKLWVNQTVNEAAPFDTSSGPQPLFTGRFEGKAHLAGGRATVYKKADGAEYLRLGDLQFNDSTPPGSDAHVLLARSGDPNLTRETVEGDLAGIDCGPLKTGSGDQDYDVPAATDLNQYAAVAIYSQKLHQVLGWAKLEPF